MPICKSEENQKDELLSLLSNCGSAEASYLLGIDLKDGDAAEAFNFFKKASEKDHIKRHLNLLDVMKKEMERIRVIGLHSLCSKKQLKWVMEKQPTLLGDALRKETIQQSISTKQQNSID